MMLKRDEKDNITQTSLSEEVDKLLDDSSEFCASDNSASDADATNSATDDVIASDSSALINGDVAAVDDNANADNLTQEPQDKPKSKGGFKKRLIIGTAIAAVYVLVALLTVLLGGYVRILFDIFVIGVSIIATIEMCNALGNKFPKPMKLLVIINVVVGFAAFYLVHFFFSGRFGNNPYSGGITAFFFVLALMFLVCILYNVFSKKHSMQNVLSTMFVLVYPTMISVYMLALNYLRPINNMGYYGLANAAILLMFLIPALSDTGAFFVGSLIKGKKLAPTISPKKTISGAVGGVLSGVIAGAIVLAFSLTGVLNVGTLPGGRGWNIAHFLIMGGVGAMFVIVGDLVASYIKRQCKVKDFSNLLPGHGGVLDRIDSMLLNSVFLYIYFFVLTFF